MVNGPLRAAERAEKILAEPCVVGGDVRFAARPTGRTTAARGRRAGRRFDCARLALADLVPEATPIGAPDAAGVFIATAGRLQSGVAISCATLACRPACFCSAWSLPSRLNHLAGRAAPALNAMLAQS